MPWTSLTERSLMTCSTFLELYISACSNSVQLVALHPIIMSILFHHYKELTEYLSEVERIEETKVNNSKKTGRLTIKEEEQEATIRE